MEIGAILNEDDTAGVEKVPGCPLLNGTVIQSQIPYLLRREANAMQFS
jgi:hypothetical protein